MNNTERQQCLNMAYEKALRLGLITNKTEFAELIGVSRSGLSAAMGGNDKYLTDSLVAKATAALNKEQYNINVTDCDSPNVTGKIVINHSPDARAITDEEMIPVIPQNIYKESDLNIVEYLEGNQVQMSPVVHQFPKTTCFYVVNTMAMAPQFHPGDILALKKVRKDAPIVNGEVYAVDTVDLGILIRYIYDRGDYVEMKSSDDSPRYESFNINKNDIYTYFRVVGLMRTNI